MCVISDIATKITNYVSKEYETKINKNKILEILKQNKQKTIETKTPVEEIKPIENFFDYKFKAECKADVKNWVFSLLEPFFGFSCPSTIYKNILNSVKKDGYNICKNLNINDEYKLPYVEVEFTSKLTINEIRDTFRNIIDSHVMLESLNYKDKYTGERYYIGEETTTETTTTETINTPIGNLQYFKLNNTEDTRCGDGMYKYLILNTGFIDRLLDSTVDEGEFKNNFNDLLKFVEKFGKIIGVSNNNNVYATENKYLSSLQSITCIDNGCIIFEINKNILQINEFLYKYFNDCSRHCNMKYINYSKEYFNKTTNSYMLYVNVNSEKY
jgi:hypothetical protein